MIIENDVARFKQTLSIPFCYLLEFSYRQLHGHLTMSDWSPDICIKLIDKRPTEYKVLELTASNVSGLIIPDNLTSAESIMIDIEDIKSRQLSGLNYDVRDVGHDECFAFMCRDFKIEIKKWELG